MSAKNKKGQLITRIVAIATAGILIMGIILLIASAVELTSAYHTMGEDELRVACQEFQQLIDYTYPGEWHMEDGVLWKGEYNLEDTDLEAGENIQLTMDEMKAETGLDYTIILDKTRAVTTIEGMKGKDIGDAAYNATRNGQGFSDYKTKINGTTYYVYYSPEMSDGKFVGSFFAGVPAAKMDGSIRRAVILMFVITLIILVVFVLIGVLLSTKYSAIMKQIADNVATLAGGELRGGVAPALKARNDELGIIAVCVDELSGKLRDVIGNAQNVSNEVESKGTDLAESASQASQASEQVTDAVGEISKGAVAQAESVENAAADTDQIGRNIDTITDNVNQLNTYTADMKQACDEAMTSLEKLLKQSEEVTECVDEIGKTIVSTNESSKQISQFSQAIADIATQTNLLSLNASIEAARAGEAGRGFAVVADEIRALADQSSQSADEIKRIVDSLLAGSEESVEVMGKLNENFGMQASQLESTRQGMNVMSDNVRNVRETSEDIAARVEDLSAAKNALTEIITDLSAISEENAASTEETNASMEELNATFTVIGEAASALQDNAVQLKDAMAFFKL